jgi:hypothetical protein
VTLPTLKIGGIAGVLERWVGQATRLERPIDPDTAELNPQILRTVNQTHENKAGMYGAVLVEGIIRRGDVIDLA